MPVISPHAFASPAANDAAAPIPATLRETVRRLERAHSARRAGQQVVPLGVPDIDALLPGGPTMGGLLTGAPPHPTYAAPIAPGLTQGSIVVIEDGVEWVLHGAETGVLHA